MEINFIVSRDTLLCNKHEQNGHTRQNTPLDGSEKYYIMLYYIIYKVLFKPNV